MRLEALSGVGIRTSLPRPFPTGRSSGKVPPPPKESSTRRLRLRPSTYPQNRWKTSLKKVSGTLRRDPTGVLGKPGRPRPNALKKQVGTPPFPPPKTTNPRRIPKEALDTEPTVCRTNALKPIDPTAFSRNPVKPIVPTTHVRDAPSVPPTNVSQAPGNSPRRTSASIGKSPSWMNPIPLNSISKAPGGNRPAHPVEKPSKTTNGPPTDRSIDGGNPP